MVWYWLIFKSFLNAKAVPILYAFYVEKMS